MKKILLGFALEQRIAKCNFCGESDKDCVKGSLPWEVTSEVPKYEHKKVIVGSTDSGYYQKTLLSKREWLKTFTDYEYEGVITGWDTKTETENADICKDCIKQLSKLIK